MPYLLRKFFIEKAKLFYVFFLLWFVVIGVLVFAFSKHDSFVFVNHRRSLAQDVLCTAMSYLADGWGVILVCLFFVIIKQYKLSVLLLLGYISTGLFNNLLKHYFAFRRPLACYGAEVVKSARWLHIDSMYSFPSGHTAIAFCTATILSNYFFPKKRLTGLFFLLACFTAYSRLYLGEHFLEDVWAGSFIGVFIGSIISLQPVLHLLGKIIRTKNSCSV